MIMEWNGNLAQDPEQVLRPMESPERRKPVRPAAAAAWEAEQLRRLRQSGLQRPKRPSHSNSVREEERAMAAESNPTLSQEEPQSMEEPEQIETSPQALTIQAADPVIEPAVEQAPETVLEPPAEIMAAPAAPAERQPIVRKPIIKSTQQAPRPKGPSGFQRLASMARTVIPIAEKLLPLLDGNVATAAANVFVQRPTPKPIDLAPLEQSIDKLKSGHTELRGELAEQSVHLGKVASQVHALEETTHRLQSERDDLQEDVVTLRKRITVVSSISFTLIGLLVLADAYFILHTLRILP